MKLVLVLVFILIGCGANIPNSTASTASVDPGTSTDTSVQPSAPAAQPSQAAPTPASASPDTCGTNYAAKIVYQDANQKLYACINNAPQADAQGALPQDTHPALILLEGCQYTYEVTGDQDIRMTYVPGDRDNRPRVIPSYLIAKGLDDFSVQLADNEGNTVCQIYSWDGQSLGYIGLNGNRHRILTQ